MIAKNFQNCKPTSVKPAVPAINPLQSAYIQAFDAKTVRKSNFESGLKPGAQNLAGISGVKPAALTISPLQSSDVQAFDKKILIKSIFKSPDNKSKK